jgi:phage tail sheath protein FI
MRKFVLGFQGGFDGQAPNIPINSGGNIVAGNTQGLDCTNINSAGSIAYKQVIGALGNADEFDINLIAAPGIFSTQHSYVSQLIIDMCEARGDCFYIMDNVVFPTSNQTTGLIDAAVEAASTIDSSYVATYYPWIKILDTNLNKIVSIPPSVILPSVYAASDNASAEWFAIAGMNRGGISQAVQVLDRLTHAERDTLYEGKVNPIAAFPGQGICVWGQKTLQDKESALDRIAVRRLLIAMKKFIASTSKFLVFEQNVAATRNRFLSIVNPYFENVQQRSGLYAFQVRMDETNNTADIIDKNILYGQIYIQPTKTAEFIVLDFNILPTGASFSN